MHRHLVACALRRATIFIAIELSLSLIAGAQDVQMLDPVLDQIVGHDAKIECVANGFDKWTEGPVWTREGTLLFAESQQTTSTSGFQVRARASSCTLADIQVHSPSKVRSQARME